MNDIIKTVTVYLLRGDEILLLYRNKKQNDINKNKYIGVGGHIEEGETPLFAAKREVFEETGLKVNNLKYRALVHFSYDDFKEDMHIYTSTDFIGEMIKCDEGDLSWQKTSELMNIPMWEGDKYFLKPIMDNHPFFKMRLKYINDELIEHKML